MPMMALAMEMVTTMPTTASVSVRGGREDESRGRRKGNGAEAATDAKAKVVMVTALAL